MKKFAHDCTIKKKIKQLLNWQIQDKKIQIKFYTNSKFDFRLPGHVHTPTLIIEIKSNDPIFNDPCYSMEIGSVGKMRMIDRW